MKKIFRSGLEGVVAIQTAISSIDGKKGQLMFRGYSIGDLAKHSSFEEVTYLLWFGQLPTRGQLKQFQKKLRSQRAIGKGSLRIIGLCVHNVSAMDALRTVTSSLAHCDPDVNKNDFKSNIRKGIALTAKFPTIVASYWRIKHGKKPIPPRSDLSPGANFLYMLRGKMPDKIAADAMDIDFLLTTEHEINASTFTARVAVSTDSDLHSAISAGISTLKGPLHGGAREKVYKMLDTIKSPKEAERFILTKMRKHQVIMGFGHRVYKTMDPRAKIFKDVANKIAKSRGNKKWYAISEKMEQVMMREFVKKKGKPIYPNVDFYTGAVYHYIKIPVELCTSIFAIGRISGWVAHCLEQYEHNRLIRPLGEYIGPKRRKFVPLAER